MSLRIRLSRGGTKKRPYYRVVVADSRSPRDGRFIERIGNYNPMLNKDDPNRVMIDEDRVRHWLGVGALPSDRVAKFLAQLGVMEARPLHEQTKKNQPKTKAQERMREAEEAAKAVAESAAAPVEAPAEEAPADEPAAEAEAPAEEAAAEAPAAEEAPAEEQAPAGDGDEDKPAAQ